METIQVIAIIAALIIAAIIVNFLFCKPPQQEVKAVNIKVETGDVNYLTGNLSFAQSNTPYKDLWSQSDCSLRGSTLVRLTQIRSNISSRHKGMEEEIYKREILHYMNKGALYSQEEKISPIRKFCIGQTIPGDNIEYRIEAAELMYKYITTGKIPNKEE